MFGEKCMEASSITGTGSYSLGTAVGEFNAWRDQFADGSTVFYCAENSDATIWEIGYGVLTYGTPDTLSRTLIVSSTGALVSWATADAPIYVFSPQMNATPGRHVLAPLVNGVANVPGWLPSAAQWIDDALGIATAWVKKRYISGTRTAAASHAEDGRYYLGLAGGAANIYAASQRALFVDKGAANYIFTADDIGKVLAFDCTAASRTLTMLAASAGGMGHSAYVFVYPYGGSVNGVTFTPGGADTTELATAPPLRLTKFQWDGARSKWVADAPQTFGTVAAAFKGAISGWTYANSAGANDIDIAAGQGVDSTGVDFMVGAALTKQLSNAWAVGTAAGGLDTGVVANADYYIWAIKRVDTGVVDYLFSLSSTAPTMPAGYTLKRLIGWIRRSGGSIVAFKGYELPGGGLNYLWSAPRLDVNLTTTLGTSRRTDTLSVPVNFSVLADINVSVNSSAITNVAVMCPDIADAAPSGTAAPLGNIAPLNGSAYTLGQMRVRTDATGKVASRADQAAVPYFGIQTNGFEWSRR